MFVYNGECGVRSGEARAHLITIKLIADHFPSAFCLAKISPRHSWHMNRYNNKFSGWRCCLLSRRSRVRIPSNISNCVMDQIIYSVWCDSYIYIMCQILFICVLSSFIISEFNISVSKFLTFQSFPTGISFWIIKYAPLKNNRCLRGIRDRSPTSPMARSGLARCLA